MTRHPTEPMQVDWPIDMDAAAAALRMSRRTLTDLIGRHPHYVQCDGPVFGYLHHWSVYKPWRAACEAAGIPYIGPHSAGRRAFATAMRAAGVDPKTAAKRGGWASIRLMLDVYAGEDDDPELIDRVFTKPGTFPAQSVDHKASIKRNRNVKSK